MKNAPTGCTGFREMERSRVEESIMRRIILGVSAVLLLFAWQTGGAFAAAAKSSCLTCHTNGEIMKSLYKPPSMEGGEAEG